MDKLYIIKIGGQIIDDAAKLHHFLYSFSGLKGLKILVHGGGKIATELAEQLGIPQQIADGRRITDAASLKVVTMVYAGWINKNLVAQLQSLNINALGLTGADGNLVTAKKREGGDKDFGFAGDVIAVNAKLFCHLLKDTVPVIAPITHDGKGQLLNTNADTMAQEIAIALSDHYEISLIYGFEKDGVLKNVGDESTVMKFIDTGNLHQLIEGGVISGGMIPKMQNAKKAIEAGVKQVIIGNAEKLAEMITEKSGTIIK